MKVTGTRKGDKLTETFERNPYHHHQRNGDRATYLHHRASDGFNATPRNWSDILAIILIITACFGGIAWGVKLELELRRVEMEHSDLKNLVSKGILPITEERMTVLTQRIADLQYMLNKLDRKVDDLVANKR